MSTIEVHGWHAGFKKVQFTMLLRETLGYSLSKAKEATDLVMDDVAVLVQVAEPEADGLVAAMTQLGARCVVLVPAR